MKVIIVGGVAGGASCAARLRRLSEDAEIVLFERGENISYANCGLPYYLAASSGRRAHSPSHLPRCFGIGSASTCAFDRK